MLANFMSVPTGETTVLPGSSRPKLLPKLSPLPVRPP
jgi:hypothetical protein